MRSSPDARHLERTPDGGFHLGRRSIDTSLQRRRAAAATVERHLVELRSILSAHELDLRIVDGSAVAVELYLAETNTLCHAVRVAIVVARQDRRRLERALVRADFEATTPAGDASLLRLAGRRGRRPVHVLFESRRDGEGSRAHPSSDEAARARVRRFAGAWREPVSTFRRERHDVGDAHDISESFEVQLFERPEVSNVGPRDDGVIPPRWPSNGS